MKMIWKTMVGAAATALMVSSLTAPAFAADPTKITLRLAFIAGGIDAPFFVALSKGYFKAENLDVTIIDGDGSTGTIQAVGNGTVQLGNAGLGALAQASAQAHFDNIVAVFGDVQKDPSSIISLKGHGINKPKDLEGKRFATEAGNLQDGMITAFADANGVDMNKVNIIITDNYKQALLKGDADFINAWADPDGDLVNDFSPIDPPMLFADYGVNLLGSSIIAKKDWLDQNGDAVKGFLRAVTKGHDDVVANPDEALDIFMQNRPDAKREAIQREIKVMEQYRHTANSQGKPFGWVSPVDLQQTIDLLEKYSGIEKGYVKPDSIYTDKYLPAAAN